MAQINQGQLSLINGWGPWFRCDFYAIIKQFFVDPLRVGAFRMVKKLVVLLFMGVCCMAKTGAAYEAAYPKTPNGTIEIKTIPAAKLLVTEAPGGYFDRNNDMFMRLFRYISANDVSMTVPVEAQIEKAEMKFYVGRDDSAKNLTEQAAVKVVNVPERTVVSIGIRGSYTKVTFEKNRDRLVAWLRENTRYRAAGDAYAVYWDAPFVPWFLKHSEVHIPVTDQKNPAENNLGTAGEK
jgi:DNA gyrase inhibitor GyrI